jgi:hypothetical protein
VIIEVLAIARHEDGVPHWTYNHVEQVIAVDDEEENVVTLAAAIQRRLDEARGSIGAQAGVDLGRRLWEREPGEEGSYGSGG